MHRLLCACLLAFAFPLALSIDQVSLQERAVFEKFLATFGEGNKNVFFQTMRGNAAYSPPTSDDFRFFCSQAVPAPDIFTIIEQSNLQAFYFSMVRSNWTINFSKSTWVSKVIEVVARYCKYEKGKKKSMLDGKLFRQEVERLRKELSARQAQLNTEAAVQEASAKDSVATKNTGAPLHKDATESSDASEAAGGPGSGEQSAAEKDSGPGHSQSVSGSEQHSEESEPSSQEQKQTQSAAPKDPHSGPLGGEKGQTAAGSGPESAGCCGLVVWILAAVGGTGALVLAGVKFGLPWVRKRLNKQSTA